MAVVAAHRDEPYPRPGGGQEIGVGVGAAVMRHLQHVGSQVRARGEDPGLGGRAQVAGEQHPDPSVRHANDEGQVVGLGVRGGPLGRRGQDLDLRPTHCAVLAGHQHGPFCAGAPHEPVEGRYPVVGGRQCSRGHDADVPPVERPRQATDVVGVQMGQQNQGQGMDFQPVQAPVDGPHVRPCVEEHALARAGGQHEGVPLADVAGHHDRVRRGPSPDGLPHRPAEHHQPEQRGECQRSKTREAPEQPPAAEDQRRQENRPGRPGRPARGCVRYRSGAFGHQHQPAHGPAGEPHQAVGERRADQGDHGGGQTQHRCRWHGRRREEVRRQRHQADGSRQAGDQRRGRQTGGRAHRNRVGDERRPRPAPQQS
jgi:hypothetical protein